MLARTTTAARALVAGVTATLLLTTTPAVAGPELAAKQAKHCVDVYKYNRMTERYPAFTSKRGVGRFWHVQGHRMAIGYVPAEAYSSPYPEEYDRRFYVWVRYRTCNPDDFLYVVYQRRTADHPTTRVWTYVDYIEGGAHDRATNRTKAAHVS